MRLRNTCVLGILALAACEAADPTRPTDSPFTPQNVISDAVHSSGTSGFVFLPPMVSNPKTSTGTFDGSLSPTVTVCKLAGGACTLTTAVFTTTSGPGSERVRLGDDHYIVNWHTKNFTLDLSSIYRVTVSVNGVDLGFADVKLVSTARDAKNIDASAYVAAVYGQTIPVKFRIAAGIPGSVTVTPPSQSVFVGAVALYSATVSDLHGNPLPDATVAWSTSGDDVGDVAPNGNSVAITTDAVGNSVITASIGGASASATLEVKRRPVAQVVVDPPTASVEVDGTQQYTAVVKDDQGNVLTDRAVTWSVSADGFASIDANGLATGLTAGTATITATSEGVSGTATLVVNAIVHEDFCTLEGLNSFGSAAALPAPLCVLRLVPAAPSRAGGAWSKTKVKVDAGFETTFKFRMSNGGGIFDGTQTGADGLAFVIQTVSATAVGGIGGGIGYDGLARSVAVEFDNWFNGELGDPNSNHVSVNTRGLLANSVNHAFSRGSAILPGDMIDGQEHTVRIVYTPGTLSIYFDAALSPNLSVSLDLTNIDGANLLDAGGTAWVGFTAATGAAWADHDILSWSFTN